MTDTLRLRCSQITCSFSQEFLCDRDNDTECYDQARMAGWKNEWNAIYRGTRWKCPKCNRTTLETIICASCKNTIEWGVFARGVNGSMVTLCHDCAAGYSTEPDDDVPYNPDLHVEEFPNPWSE